MVVRELALLSKTSLFSCAVFWGYEDATHLAQCNHAISTESRDAGFVPGSRLYRAPWR